MFFIFSNTLRIPLRKPCLRGLQCPAPLGWQGHYLLVGSAFPLRIALGFFYMEFLCLWAVNHTPILTYRGDKSLQSIKKKKKKKKNYYFYKKFKKYMFFFKKIFYKKKKKIYDCIEYLKNVWLYLKIFVRHIAKYTIP